MMWFFCNSCGKGYNVCGDPQEVSHLLFDSRKGYSCITPMCHGRLAGTVPQSHSVRFKEVHVSAFYRAVKGFGASATASLAKATRALLEKRVVAVEGEPIGTPERAIIRCLVLEDGTRLHFDTSSRGACLYHIEEPGNEPTDADIEDAGEGGEEAGRSAPSLPEVIEG